MIRVVVVDDHHLVRSGIRGLLDADPRFEVVGEAANGREGVDLAVALSPDVVLMDLSMPVLDGVAATRLLSQSGCSAAILVLTSFSDRVRVRDVLDAGAIGYILKDAEPRDLLAAVQSAAAGHVPLDPRVAGVLLPEPTGGSRRAGAQLSPRELEVLHLVARGLPNKQIARTLGITERTVKAHLGRVFREIGVLDRTSAALWARDHLDSDA